MNEMKTVTAQEIFDRVWRHFVDERGLPAIDDCHRCRYRLRNRPGDTDVRRCAFGVLIPEELYSWEMEGLSVGDILHRWPEVARTLGLGPNQDPGWVVRELLQELQLAHDSTAKSTLAASFHGAFERALREVAIRFELAVPAVQQ